LENLTNGVATHFTIQYGTVNGKRVAYRHGHCEKCAPEYAHGRKLHPIPKRLTPSPSPEGAGCIPHLRLWVTDQP
jgi:hypothetical protein